MSVFIDTGVFVAARNTRDINHKRAVELLEKAIRGEYGEIFTSDYVFGEAVTVALVRTGRPDIAARTGQLILAMPRIHMVFVVRNSSRMLGRSSRGWPLKGSASRIVLH